ncbi:MAG: InlB B-repeat-containing protein [Eubacteriales bacterium]|nr:InlB B-repeat-containing protein [Eubacteriales bacterium]
MTRIRKTISLLLLVCCVLSLFSASFAGADSCTHIPDATGHCMYCGALLVTEDYSAALSQVSTLESSTQTVSSDESEQENTVSDVLAVSSSGTPSSCAHEPGEDGCCLLCGAEIVASGDNRFFSSVQDAFTFGGNIRLLRDIDSDEDTSVTVEAGQAVSLDLNGKKLGIEHLFSINNYGILTVCDSSDNKGEIFGSIYTKGFEEREYNEDGSYIIIDSAYGAKTTITGGRILGDVEVGHDSGRSYTASASKPNPSLVFEDGYMIGGRFSLPEQERGEIHINGGCFTVEPPASFIKKGYEAKHSDGYYRIERIKYIAGWEATAVSADPGMTAHARAVAKENSAVNNFYTDDFGYVDASDILLGNGLTFAPETDRVVCSLEINALNAETEGEGVSEKVTSMSFSVNPVFRLYRGDQFISIDLSWEQIEGWGTTMRFPVDSSVTNKYVNVYSGEKLIQEKVEICSAGGNKYAQLYVGKGYFNAGIRYEVYVPETCAVSYTPEGGLGDPVYETVAGGGTLTVRTNPYPRDHYTFAGWMGSDGIVYSEGQKLYYVIDDMSFSALWEPDRYDLFYELDGGNNSPNNPLSYQYDDTVYLSEPEKEGAIFGGWYDNPRFEGDAVTVLMPGTFGEKKLYVKWMVSVTVIISGDGSGIVADSSRQYSSGDSVELLSGESFNANIFNAEDSFISAILKNGDNMDISSALVLEDIRESVEIEIVFSSASAVNGQLVDFSEAKAENGSELSSSLLSRAENAFENANVTNFSDTGIEEAIDFDIAKSAFESETGEKVGEYDTVNVMLQMSVLTVITDDGNRITGYKIDIKPVMTVVSADGAIKNGGVPVVVPNEAIMHAVTFRIPVDQLAFMDDIVAFHEGELMGYFKIEGETPNRYVELTADSFSIFEIQVVVGSTNHPQAAIGQYGYTTLSNAVAGVQSGEVIYILIEKDKLSSIPTDLVTGWFNDIKEENVPLKSLIDKLQLPSDEVKIQKGSGTYLIKLASEDMKPAYIDNGTGSNDIKIVYVGNGGTTTSGKGTVIDIEPKSSAAIKENSVIDFTNGSLVFLGWNTKEDGSGTFIEPGTTVTEDTTLFATWAKVKVEFRDGTENYYQTLKAAYDACKTRDKDGADTIVLLADVDGEEVKFSKELIIETNGHKGSMIGEIASGYTALYYGPSNNNIQIRKKYKINLELDGGTYGSSSMKYLENYRNESTTVSTPTLSGATFRGWYYDEDFTKPVTSEGNNKYSIPSVNPPEWPEDITIYAKWVYTITVYNNNYGYIEYGGRKLSSGEKVEVNRNSNNKFTFHPYDGYKVYNVTADNVKQGECYSYSFDAVKANHVLVVTFARGSYNPFTGDTGRNDFWLALMGMSALFTAAALILLHRKKNTLTK